MVTNLLIGLCAGLASALLFASIASGSLLSIILFYLAPLPILMVALGWSHWAALIAVIGAAVGLSAVFNGYFFLAFVATVGLPAWWLGYLAMLARPLSDTAHDFEWYPVGRLVLWAAILGALVVIIAIPNFGTDEESFRANLRQLFEKILTGQSQISAQAQPDSSVNITRLLDLFVAIMPAAAAVLATITNVVNLWLAGRIVKMSGRLRRPWPDIAAMNFPRWAPALLAVTVAASFLPILLGTMASIVATSLLMAYAVLGFAVLHAVTRERNARGFVLSGSYISVLIFGWPVLLMTLIGLAESAFDLRSRFMIRRGPPSSSI